jgi:hypothetical protein
MLERNYVSPSLIHSVISSLGETDLRYGRRPSEGTERDVKGKRVTGSICGHESLFGAQLNIYSQDIPKSIQLFAAKIFQHVRLRSLLTFREENVEKHLTAMFAAILQQLQEAHQLEGSEVLWLHQYDDIDCLGFKKLVNPTTKKEYYEPKVYFVFSLLPSATCELLAYINNCDIDLVHKSHWPVCLGLPPFFAIYSRLSSVFPAGESNDDFLSFH